LIAAISSPLDELEFALVDSDAVMLVASGSLIEAAKMLSERTRVHLIELDSQALSGVRKPSRPLSLPSSREALMIYTRLRFSPKLHHLNFVVGRLAAQRVLFILIRT